MLHALPHRPCWLAGSLVGAACLAACSGPEPGQLTVVQGTATSATTGRPLPKVLLGIEAYQRSLLGPLRLSFTGDSVRTDGQGRYELHFATKKDLYYVVSFEPSSLVKTPNYGRRYAFLTHNAYDQRLGPGTEKLTIGKANVVDFRPDELRTLAVRIRNRNTGYQQLFFNNTRLHGSNLDTVAYLASYYPLDGETRFTYRKLTPGGVFVKDTVVSLLVRNPAALPPDTLQATLTFVR